MGRPDEAPAPRPWQLLRAAEVVLSRPALAELAATVTAAEYAAAHGDALRRLWAVSEELRRAVGENLAGARESVPGARAELAAGSGADAAPDRDDKQLRRLRTQLADARKKERLHRGRSENAQAEAAALRARLAAAEERIRQAEEKAAVAAMERDALSLRAYDPVRGLRTVHRALRDMTSRRSSDPRDTAHPSSEAAGVPDSLRPLQTVLKDSGTEPTALLASLDALLVPRLASRSVSSTTGRGAADDAAESATGLRVLPLGGGTEIGGSCVLVEWRGTRILVDAGTRHDEHVERSGPPLLDDELTTGGPVAAVVVTHAHNDHCGYVPALVRRMPGTRVLCSAPTAELLPLMWRDAATLMRRQAQERRAWGDDTARAPYGELEAAAAGRSLEDIPFGVPVPVGELSVELFPAGHVLGSAGVVVHAGGSRVVVTGDLSTERQAAAEALDLPRHAEAPDLLVVESTCCDIQHTPREATVAHLLRFVRETYDNGGRVLIPAMGLGRAQELALLLGTRLPDLPVLVDGLAGTISEVYGRHADAAGLARPVLADRVRQVRDRGAERLVFRRGVVITTAGTLRGGPAVEWARDILPDPAAALVVCGYQDEESPGRRLLELAGGGPAFELPDGPVQVRAAVRQFQLGAHADRNGLLKVIDRLRPRDVMLVHGHARAQKQFRDFLRARGDHPVATGEWRSRGLPPLSP
jgi:Cft2 family RNA processing exonuclease